MARARTENAAASLSDTVVSLARGLNILRIFRPDEGPLSQTEILKRSGLPKATAARLVHTLTVLGYLEKNEPLGRFLPGAPVLAVGRALLGGLGIRSLARPSMQDLADRTDASVALGIEEGTEILYLEHCTGAAAVQSRLGVGSLVPMATTAAGWAYLWALPRLAREALLSRITKESGAHASLVMHGIQHAFSELDQHGFCPSFGAWRREVYAAAAPLTFKHGETVLVISCSVPSLGTSEKLLYERYGPELLGTIRAIVNALGQTGPDQLGFGEDWHGNPSGTAGNENFGHF